MNRIAIIAAVALLAPGVAAAADLSGAWKLDVKVNDMSIPVTCTFTDTGGALSGTCARTDDGSKTAALTGTLDGSTAKWAYDVTFQDMPLHIAYTGAMTSDTAMTGTLDVAGGMGTFTATKQ